MARAYTLNIAADTRAVKVGIDKGVIDPLEDALDVLEDIGRDGGRDLDKLEDAARDAQDSTEKVKKEFSDLAKEIRDTGRKAKTDFGDKVRGATDEASEGMKELKDEGTGTAKELAASFDGSAESIGEGFQEVAANAFAGFGPAGAAAGIAAAIGLGAVTAELQRQQEEADEMKERLAAAYRSAIEEGNAYVSEAIIQESALDLIQSDRADSIRKNAKLIGVDLNTLLRAEAGDYEALQKVIAAAEEAQRKRFDSESDAAGRRPMMIDTEIGALEGVIRKLEDQRTEHDKNRQAAREYADFVASSEQRVVDANNRQVASIAGIRDGYSRIPRKVTTVVEAQADTVAADRAMRAFANKTYRVKVDIEGRLQNGQRII